MVRIDKLMQNDMDAAKRQANSAGGHFLNLYKYGKSHSISAIRKNLHSIHLKKYSETRKKIRKKNLEKNCFSFLARPGRK